MALDSLFHIDPKSVADAGDELAIQVRFRGRARIVMPRVRIVAIPNAGERGMKAIAQVGKEGLAKGFVDCLALWPETVAFLEFKSRDGTLSPDQESWLNWLHMAGFPCGVFRSADTAIDFLLRHGAPSLTGQTA